jgi:hypothetical protein
MSWGCDKDKEGTVTEDKFYIFTRCRWLMSVILTTQEAEIRRIAVQGKEFMRSYLKKIHHIKGLVEWLKV